MKAHIVLNKRDFIITVTESAECPNYSEFLCYSEEKWSGVYSSSTEAFNICYKEIFGSNSKFSDPQVMGVDNSNIVQ